MFFNNFDMIFVSGSVKIMPWSKKAQQLLILMRMCLKTNKNVFACGLGFFTLAYLSATNLKKWSPRVINGRGYGSSIHKERHLKFNKRHFDANDCFLDNITGNMYLYNNDLGDWEEVGNIGLHNRKAAQDCQLFGSYILNQVPYRSK